MDKIFVVTIIGRDDDNLTKNTFYFYHLEDAKTFVKNRFNDNGADIDNCFFRKQKNHYGLDSYYYFYPWEDDGESISMGVIDECKIY